MSSTTITSAQDFQDVVATLAADPRNKFNQIIRFVKIGQGSEQGKITTYDTTRFRIRSIECDGPILPHTKIVPNRGDLGPKRPTLRVVTTPESDAFQLLTAIDLACRTAYEFSKTKLGEAFPELLTFYHNAVTIAPTRATPSGTHAFEVIVVLKNGVMKTLSEFLPEDPSKLNAAQSAAITQLANAKRISEKEVIDDEEASTKAGAASASPPRLPTRKTFVFESLEVKIDKKTNRLYLDMLLLHKTYPNNNRHYIGKDHPYVPEMSDIKQWGIEIPRLGKIEDGGYALYQGSDWVKEPGFKAVTTPTEHNSFIGTILFTVDSVKEGPANTKTWWKTSVLKQPEASSWDGTTDYGEDVIEMPSGAAVALSSAPKALQGKIKIGEDDDE